MLFQIKHSDSSLVPYVPFPLKTHGSAVKGH